MAALRRLKADVSCGRGAPASFRLARPSMCAPRLRRRSAEASSCGSTASKASSTWAADFGKRVQPFAVLSVIRADTRASRTPAACARSSRLGHSSLSTKTPSAGRQCWRKASTAPGASIGGNWWITPAGNRSCRMAAEVTVPEVTSRRRSGRSRDSRSTSGSSDRVSPTLAPCSQTRSPGGRATVAIPSRSSTLASSSLPRRTRASSRRGASGSSIRVSQR